MRIRLVMYENEVLVEGFIRGKWFVPDWDEWELPELADPFLSIDHARKELNAISDYLEYNDIQLEN